MATPQRGTFGALVSSSGEATVTWPSHSTGDIGLLLCETANETLSLATAAGFSSVSASPQGAGTAASQQATLLTAFWCRATSNQMTAPTLADPGSHVIARMFTVTGCVETGIPWSVATGRAVSSATSTVSIPGATTEHDDCLVLAVVSNPRDANIDQASNWTNASLTSFGHWTSTQKSGVGNGGGFNIATGELASAGAYTATEAVLAASMLQGHLSLAFRPPPPAPQPDSPSSSTSQHPTKVYANAGTYVVKLTVTDATGLSSTTSASITIS